jgi:CRISPR system Cascade subunit CasE
MVRLRFSLPHLMRLARDRGLPLRSVDEGYLVHCQMGELFGDLTPKPFAAVGHEGRCVDVVAYSAATADTLKAHADAYADPTIHATCDWSRFDSKPMPGEWREGARVGFSVRVCPVVRTGTARATHRKGPEIDAFLAICESAGDHGVGREEVYREWLSAQMSHRGVRIISAAMCGFDLTHIVRRTHDISRKSRVSERPDVTFQGEVEITDARGFDELLRRGVGRHRSFGFGMLLLRPARSTAC